MYSVRYSCSNCGHDFSQEFPKGQEADFKVVCPNCECDTGERSLPLSVDIVSEPLPYPYQPYYPYYQPWSYYYPRFEPQKPLWEWYCHDWQTTAMWATDTDETGPGGILDNILQKYSGAWEKLAEV